MMADRVNDYTLDQQFSIVVQLNGGIAVIACTQ